VFSLKQSTMPTGTLLIPVGLVRTIYIHRMWPYIQWFSCQNTVYTPNIYTPNICMVLANQ
jgi:hypothetical protein